MARGATREFTAARSFDEAVIARSAGAAVLAGGTWMMRAPRRGLELPEAVVSLADIPELSRIEIGADHIAIGAAVTHAALARALAGLSGFEGLVQAAEGAANPGVRRMATIGGNLCAIGFAAADLAPALLVREATIELATREGARRIGIATFLAGRETLLPGAIVARVIVPRDLSASAHMRLPLRKAGDYPVAIVSLALDRDGRLRVAVGAVEPVARRWIALEGAVAQQPASTLDPAHAARLATDHNDFQCADMPEAEGWYRREVLAPLVRRGVAALQKSRETA